MQVLLCYLVIVILVLATGLYRSCMICLFREVEQKALTCSFTMPRGLEMMSGLSSAALQLRKRPSTGVLELEELPHPPAKKVAAESPGEAANKEVEVIDDDDGGASRPSTSTERKGTLSVIAPIFLKGKKTSPAAAHQVKGQKAGEYRWVGDCKELSEEVLAKIGDSGHGYSMPPNSKLPAEHNRWFFWYVQQHLREKQPNLSAVHQCIQSALKDGVLPISFMTQVEERERYNYVFYKLKNIKKKF